jgi:DNA-directed RNA polymerase subunit RPC12/RpoP
MERKQEETIEKEKKTRRDVYTAYICARCDTDFGINEHGCNLKTFTYALVCPMCGYNKFHVYYVVEEVELPAYKRPPIAKTEELQQINEEDEKDEW